MRKSKASVGLLLMDQKAVAGIGNIYRAEILYKVCLSLLSLECLGISDLSSLTGTLSQRRRLPAPDALLLACQKSANRSIAQEATL